MANKRKDFLTTIVNINEEDLRARLEEDKQRLKKMEFVHTISPLESPMTIRALRRDIARIQTVLTSKKQA